MAPEILIEIMTRGWQASNNTGKAVRCVEGLPEGAKLAWIGQGTTKGELCFVVEHESFDMWEPPQVMPAIKVQFEVSAV